MGKYTDHLNYLREQRSSKERHFQSLMANYGSVMGEMYRQLNEQHHAMRMRMYDNEIREAERKA